MSKKTPPFMYAMLLRVTVVLFPKNHLRLFFASENYLSFLRLFLKTPPPRKYPFKHQNNLARLFLFFELIFFCLARVFLINSLKRFLGLLWRVLERVGRNSVDLTCGTALLWLRIMLLETITWSIAKAMAISTEQKKRPEIGNRDSATGLQKPWPSTE